MSANLAVCAVILIALISQDRARSEATSSYTCFDMLKSYSIVGDYQRGELYSVRNGGWMMSDESCLGRGVVWLFAQRYGFI